MAFWVGLLFGTVQGFYALGWLTVVSRFNPLIYAGIPPAAVWWGLHQGVACALIVYFARNLSPWKALPMAMMTWAGMEYFRAIGALGLPLAMLGHSLGGWPQLAQAASLGGVPLLSALIIGINLCWMEIISAVLAKSGQAEATVRFAMVSALIAGGVVYGSKALSSSRDRDPLATESFDFHIALIQTGIDQEKKFQSYAADDEKERMRLQDEMLASMMKQIGSLQPGEVDLIVTPESSLTNDYVDIEESIQKRLFGGVVIEEILAAAKELKTPIVVGGVDNVFKTTAGDPTESLAEGSNAEFEFNPGHEVYGAMWLIRPDDQGVRPVADYRKIQLLPFGETVPYLGLIPGFAEKVVQVGTFARGTRVEPIGMLIQRDGAAQEVKLGPSICFEDLFGSLHRNHAAHGAQLFVNTTNDAWFDDSAGPLWHEDMARWRSIEMRIPMVRCTNSGVTSVIDQTGKVTESLPLKESGILKATIKLQKNPRRTIYSRIGESFGAVSMIVTALAWLILMRIQGRRAA
ncbi:apolipoprotein N-acyltransferase [soil metagenome]